MAYQYNIPELESKLQSYLKSQFLERFDIEVHQYHFIGEGVLGLRLDTRKYNEYYSNAYAFADVEPIEWTLIDLKWVRRVDQIPLPDGMTLIIILLADT